MFNKKKSAPPHNPGPSSTNQANRTPQPINPATTAAPVKLNLTLTELAQLREAKFKQLKIPYEKVLAAQREFKTVFDPDLVEQDYINVNKKLESYNFDFRISASDLFTCLIIIKKIAGPPVNERQISLINSLSNGIVHTEFIMNLIVWKHIEQQIRQAEKLALTDHVPEIKVIAAGKAFWQNIDRLMIWKQAEKQLRHSQHLADNLPLSKEEVEKRYQELMAKKR